MRKFSFLLIFTVCMTLFLSSCGKEDTNLSEQVTGSEEVENTHLSPVRTGTPARSVFRPDGEPLVY